MTPKFLALALVCLCTPATFPQDWHGLPDHPVAALGTLPAKSAIDFDSLSPKELSALVKKINDIETPKELDWDRVTLQAAARFFSGAAAADKLKQADPDKADMALALVQGKLEALLDAADYPAPNPQNLRSLAEQPLVALVHRISAFEIQEDLGWSKADLESLWKFLGEPATSRKFGQGMAERASSPTAQAEARKLAKTTLTYTRYKLMETIDLMGIKPMAEADRLAKAITEADYEAEVEDSPIPVVADFWATWCVPCKIMAPILEDLAKEYQGRVKFVRVDVDAQPKLAEKMKVEGLPAIVFLKQGREVYRGSGINVDMKRTRADYAAAIEKNLLH